MRPTPRATMAVAATLAVFGSAAVLTANPASAGVGLQRLAPELADVDVQQVSRASARGALDPQPATSAAQQAAQQAAQKKAAAQRAAAKKVAQQRAIALAPVAGIPAPCEAKHPWPEKATPAQRRAQLQRFTGITLQGPGWDAPANTTQVKLVWQTLDALSCTDYLGRVKAANKGFALYAGPTRSWAWGDWGLTHPGAVTLDFAKFSEAIKANDPGRVVRIIVHEIGHAWSMTPGAQKTYAAFAPLHGAHGRFGPYAYNRNENFSEVIGYYVARCAKDNPYDGGEYTAYYQFVKKNVFAGREFGPEPGQKSTCATT